MKQLQMPLVQENHGFAQERFLFSGSNAAVMWANGLGQLKATPSASAQAAPAPILFRSTVLSTWIACLQLADQGMTNQAQKNQVMERPYDC